MGEPVRIVDLADKMIRLSGKEPGTEIAIEFIGPAPGEKLHEVLVGDDETVDAEPRTRRSSASRARPSTREWLEGELAELERLVQRGDTLELVGALSRIVADPARRPTAAGSDWVPGTAERGRAPVSGAYAPWILSRTSCPPSRL